MARENSNNYPKLKKNLFKKLISSIIDCCKEFCMETSIHGFNHIAADRRHWIERLLWIFFTAVAVWGVVDISLGQWQRYIENPTVVTLEKDYRTWRFYVPAVTSCEKDRVSPEKLPKAIKSFWNVDIGEQKYAYYQKFVNVVANSDLFHLQGYEEFKDDGSLKVDLYKLAVEVMPEVRIKMGPSFPFPQKWIPVMTEAGACYAINSIAVADVAVKPDKNNTQTEPTTCKYSTQSCFVMFESPTITHYYVHSPFDVVNIMIPPSTTFPTLNRYVELIAMETRTGQGVRNLSPKTRHCRYNNEPTVSSRQIYSTNTCRQDCRGRLAMKLCGCKPFYYFYDDGPTCTPSGMWCLASHTQTLANFGGIKCACSQQCLDAVYRDISSFDQLWRVGSLFVQRIGIAIQRGIAATFLPPFPTDGTCTVIVRDIGPFQSRGGVRFTIQAPRIRYTRNIVFHLQDLVVSFGGAAGLFLGASFISFVEIGYFILQRIFKSRRPKTAEVNTETVPYERRIAILSSILQKNFEDKRTS